MSTPRYQQQNMDFRGLKYQALSHIQLPIVFCNLTHVQTLRCSLIQLSRQSQRNQ